MIKHGELLKRNNTRGDSFTEYPTYIKHWEEARPWGWEIRILTENGLHTFHCKWKTIDDQVYSRKKKSLP